MKNNIKDKDINIADMFYAILLRWRLIVLVALVCAGLIGCYSYVRGGQHEDEVVQAEPIKSDDQKMMEIERYLTLKQIYQEQNYYIQNSPLMQLDAKGYYEAILTYSFGMNENLSESCQSALLEAYRAKFMRDEFYEELSLILGDEVMQNYFYEIVDADDNLAKAIYGIQEQSELDNDTFTVIIRHNSKEKTENMANLVKNTIQNAGTEISTKIFPHTTVLIAENVYLKADNEILAYQQKKIGEMEDYYSVLNVTESNLSEQQIQYMSEIDGGEIKEEARSEKEITEISAINIKGMILGAGVGGILVILLLAFLYLGNRIIRLEDDIEELYGIAVLARVTKEESRKGVFSFIDTKLLQKRRRNVDCFTQEDGVGMIVFNIKLLCERYEKKEIVLSRDSGSTQQVELAKKISSELAKHNIKILECASILRDGTALECATKVSTIILMEGTKESDYYSVCRELEQCNSYGINVLGTVIVEE